MTSEDGYIRRITSLIYHAYEPYLSRILDVFLKKFYWRIHLYFNLKMLRVRENRLKPNVQIKCLMRLRNRTPNWLGKISGRRIKTFMLSDYMMWIIIQISCYKFDMQANVHQRLVCKTDSPLRRYRVFIDGSYISRYFKRILTKNFLYAARMALEFQPSISRREFIYVNILLWTSW